MLSLPKFTFTNILFFIILISACYVSPDKRNRNPTFEEVSTNHLNSLDTITWEFYQAWELDNGNKVVLSKSKYHGFCHACGPKLSLTLLSYDTLNNTWKVNAHRFELDVLTSWGKVPRFNFVKTKDRSLLTVDFGYGNNGSESRTIKIFDLDYCSFASPTFVYTYQSQEEAIAHRKQLQKYLPQFVNSEDRILYSYQNDIHFSIDSITSKLTISSKMHTLTFHDLESSDEESILNLKLEPIQEEFIPILCSWGKAISPYHKHVEKRAN